MPINFHTGLPYMISYDDYFNFLDSQEILKDKGKQSLLLNRWKEKLIAMDKLSIMGIGLHNYSDDTPTFKKDIDYNGKEIFLHFVINDLEKILNDNKMHISRLSLSLFDEQFGPIGWTPVETTLIRSKVSSYPLIIAPYANYQHEKLVIDGNHRLTYYMTRKLKLRRSLDVCILPFKYIIDTDIMPSMFDKAFYIMINEFKAIKGNENNISDDEILKLSYAYTDKISIEIYN